MRRNAKADALPWILAAIAVAIMSTAVVLYPKESEASNTTARMWKLADPKSPAVPQFRNR